MQVCKVLENLIFVIRLNDVMPYGQYCNELTTFSSFLKTSHQFTSTECILPALLFIKSPTPTKWSKARFVFIKKAALKIHHATIWFLNKTSPRARVFYERFIDGKFLTDLTHNKMSIYKRGSSPKQQCGLGK